MKKNTKVPSKTARNLVVGAITIILLIAAAYTLKNFYDWSYKRGYLEGTDNQVLCQAAQKDTSLTKLCR